MFWRRNIFFRGSLNFVDKEEGFGGFWEIRNLGGGVFGAAEEEDFFGGNEELCDFKFFFNLNIFFQEKNFSFLNFFNFFNLKKTFPSVFSIPFFRSSKKSGPPLLQILEKHFSTEKNSNHPQKKIRYFVSSILCKQKFQAGRKK